ncbi:candidate ABC type sugar transport system, permease component [Ramlibacter tataouinensis TTB310]|uniref:sn-glycerol-3-phosphate transport system permease protein UgpE n=1 Tax=Ramlibacter tataouinensis (strain ATCC BAA-407 / DSM 14655 / LMG 21543 / TTB310) TaxID=365046 RepID=F5XW04_RAMTT|nr:candidate ABC type sugar transport system, permease component [Ramlibacter tataouinensis TTB310]
MAHAILAFFSVLALAPIAIIVMNAFKSRDAIFGAPLEPPTTGTFDLIGFRTVFANGNFDAYFMNSFSVTLVALGGTILFGSMAAFALSEYKFKLNSLTALFFTMGIMVPIRLGTPGILELMVASGLVNTRTALVLVYIAQGLPMAIFILAEYMRTVSDDLKNAGRVDGLSEYVIFFWLVLPLLRPAMVSVAVFTMIPMWNDLWFPLILAPGEDTKTLTLGAQAFIGQDVTDWNSVLAALTLSILPVLALYLVFSKGLIRGITSGAIK